jgi:hypothetical protein
LHCLDEDQDGNAKTAAPLMSATIVVARDGRTGGGAATEPDCDETEVECDKICREVGGGG